MKTNLFIRLLGVIGATAVLTITTANAKPDKDQKDHPPSQKADKQDGKDKAKAGQKNKKPNKQSAKNDEQDKKEWQKAQGKQDRGNEQKSRADNSPNRKDAGDKQRGKFKGRLEERDRDRVVSYFSEYKGRNRGLPPGLARKWESGRRLPPAWRDRVVTGYVIEDDWFPAFEPVPYAWFPGIVVVPDTRLYWYGDRVVRVYEPTREVVDVIIIPTIHIDL